MKVVKLNMHKEFTFVELLIVIVILAILITIGVGATSTDKKTERECTLMFNLANDLRDTVRIVKIRKACLQYVQIP